MLTVEPQETYRGLPEFDYGRRWFEVAISIVESWIIAMSGPLLTVGIGFSMMDFLLNGSLLTNPHVAFAWAFIQVAVVDTQLVSLWHKAKVEYRDRGLWTVAFWGYVVLGLVLASVAFGANVMPSLAKALHVTLGDGVGIAILVMRSGVAIILACIAGWQRVVTRLVARAPERMSANQVREPDQGASRHTAILVRGSRTRMPMRGMVRAFCATMAATALEDANPPRTPREPQLAAAGSARTGLRTLPRLLPEATGEAFDTAGSEPVTTPLPVVTAEVNGVAQYIRAQREAGREPTLAEIMEATGCSKSTASKYRAMAAEPPRTIAG